MSKKLIPDDLPHQLREYLVRGYLDGSLSVPKIEEIVAGYFDDPEFGEWDDRLSKSTGLTRTQIRARVYKGQGWFSHL